MSNTLCCDVATACRASKFEVNSTLFHYCIGGMTRFYEAFRKRSSGTAKRVRSRRASNEPDSRTSPGMSLLVAIQTLASSSQVKVMIYSIKDTSCEYYMNIIVPQICISYSFPITLPRHRASSFKGTLSLPRFREISSVFPRFFTKLSPFTRKIPISPISTLSVISTSSVSPSW